MWLNQDIHLHTSITPFITIHQKPVKNIVTTCCPKYCYFLSSKRFDAEEAWVMQKFIYEEIKRGKCPEPQKKNEEIKRSKCSEPRKKKKKRETRGKNGQVSDSRIRGTKIPT
jgi:hypothetical protein